MNEKDYLLSLLTVVRSEAETVSQYLTLPKDAATEAMFEEIISDELNHALVALLTFARTSGIKIAADELDGLLDDDLFTEE